MPDTPIETARRVWPGEWSTIDLHFLRRRLTKGGTERSILPVIIEAHPSDLGSIWRVRLRSNGVGVDIGGPGPLTEALTTARQKVIEAILELVCGAGMHPLDVPQGRDVAALTEIIAERQRAYAKWGPQPYPWTCYEDEDINGLHEIAERLERVARDAMADRTAKGLSPTRAQIVAEEAGEALREIDPKKARAELIQLGAMCLAALSECPDLREVPRG